MAICASAVERGWGGVGVIVEVSWLSDFNVPSAAWGHLRSWRWEELHCVRLL